MNFYALAAIGAYLLGSIPTSYWIGKFFFGIDIRDHGSGNAGATNTFRVLGLKVALPVLLFDIFKGFIAVELARILPVYSYDILIRYQVLFGISAIMGHIFPVFAKFRGGKGVATLAGVLIAVNPMLLLYSLIVFLVVVLATRMISAGSIIAAMSIPIQFYFIFHIQDIFQLSFALAIFLIVAITHFENIKRIIAGEENTISFKKK